VIQPIVEGHGEVEAVPVLLRRLLAEAGRFDIEIGRPIRRKRSELVDEAGVRRAIKLSRLKAECRAILIMFDADSDCPATLAPQVEAWAQSEAGPLTCAVVMPNREYEAWFLASMESLRGVRGIRADATSHDRPEAPRGAKERIERWMPRGRSYSETSDQAALTATFDMTTTFAKCRSFRRLARAFERSIVGGGQPLGNWPPATWRAGEA